MPKSSEIVTPDSSVLSMRCVRRRALQKIDIQRVEAIIVSESSHTGSMNYESFKDLIFYMQSGNSINITVRDDDDKGKKIDEILNTFEYFHNQVKPRVPVLPIPMPSNSWPR